MNAPPFPLNTPSLQMAESVVKTLRDRGFAAYFVGGCVRDLVMGLQPQEVDIATDATPDEVQELFPNTVAVGAPFGVVLVLVGEKKFEVATFRSEASYTDGRHPEAVHYAKTPEEDSRRRDFTLNALFYDPLESRLLDFHGGREDMGRKVIRAIGDPQERFREDKLRLLRAVRFAVRFGFEIENRTRQAIVKAASEIHRVSAERIRDELTRLLIEGYSHAGFVLLDELGLLKEVLPELPAMKGVEQPPEFHPEGDVWVHTMLVLKGMDETIGALRDSSPPPEHTRSEDRSRRSDSLPQTEKGSSDIRPLTSDFNEAFHSIAPRPVTEHLDPGTYPSPILAWGALLHDVGKPATFKRAPDRIRFDGHMELGARAARQIGHRLRMSNEEIDAIAELVLEHLKFKDVRQMRTATLKRFVRREHFAEHLELHRLDCLASHGNLEAYEFTLNFARALKPEEARPKAILTGHDLIELGYTPGPRFKAILTALEDAQLENQIADRNSARQFLAQEFPLKT